MKRLIILILTVLTLLILAIKPPNVIYQQQLKSDYYEVISAVNQLFKDHTKHEELYYNRNYQSKEEIEEFLQGKVTKNGLAQIFNEIFAEDDNIAIYNDELQQYLKTSREYYINSTSKKDEDGVSYYETVRNTILNPALRMVSLQQFKTSRDGEFVDLKGENIQVTFYNEDDGLINKYFRYGYPPKESFHLTFSFLYREGKYLLDSFTIEVDQLNTL